MKRKVVSLPVFAFISEINYHWFMTNIYMHNIWIVLLFILEKNAFEVTIL